MHVFYGLSLRPSQQAISLWLQLQIKIKREKSIAHIAQNIGQTVYVINSVQSKIHIKSLTQIMMLSGGQALKSLPLIYSKII